MWLPKNMKIINFFRQNKHLLMLVAITIFFIFLPLFNLFLDRNFKWPGITKITSTYYQGGWSYYEVRSREIIDGHPFIGNPYFLEHNKEVPVAFFLADWLAAIPRLLGVSTEWFRMVNLLFWSLIFVFLAYGILREVGASKAASVIGAELSYLQVFHKAIELVSLQTVFPFYLFFLWSFLLWTKDHTNKRRTFLLVLASTISFYIYTYLWQITLTTLVVSILFWLMVKNKEKALGLIKVFGWSIIFSAPLFIVTYLQLTHPAYWDSMQRIGLISTHLPPGEIFYSGRWVMLIILLWSLGLWWHSELKASRAYKLSCIFFAISGMSLVVVSSSNIITGKELEQSSHMVWFILAWAPLAFVAFLFFVKNYWALFKFSNKHRKIIIFILCLATFFGLVTYQKRYWSVDTTHRQAALRNLEKNQTPIAALNWLENREEAPVVVWADSKSIINGYVPALTKHYVLFEKGGTLHLVSSREVEERYLVSNYFNQLTLDDIKRDFSIYAGVGNAIHPSKVHNRKIIWCQLIRLNLLGVDCGQKTDALTLKGEKYFIDLHNKYKNEILPNINYYLKKYHVAYFIRDRQINSDINPEPIGLELVYSDANFDIYKIKDF